MGTFEHLPLCACGALRDNVPAGPGRDAVIREGRAEAMTRMARTERGVRGGVPGPESGICPCGRLTIRKMFRTPLYRRF